MKRKARSIIYKYASITIGGFLIAAAINLFFRPHHLLSNGITGIAIILNYMFDWPVGVQMFIFNIPMLVLAYKLIGKGYALSTLYGTILLSAAIDITSFLIAVKPVSDPLLSAIAGGVIAGVGGGLSFRVGGSLGGLDILSTIFKKYYSFNVGTMGFAVNFAITVFGAALFGLELAILTLISMFLGAKVTDLVVEGINRKKSVYIISYKAEDIVKAILNEVGRGATILHGEGAYTRQSKQVVFVVLRLTQVAKIKELVHQADPEAFMIINDAAEVLGRGFARLNM